MSIYESMMLSVIMVTLSAIPSTSVVFVITRSATMGISNGIAASAGIVFGDVVFVALAISGLTVVAEAMGSLFVFVRLLAGLYLIWVGFSLFFRRDQTILTAARGSNERGLLASFMAGFILTLGDVKAIVFYASLLPVFVDMFAVGASDIAIIVLITVFSVGGVKTVYAISGRNLATYMQRADMENAARKTAGTLMIGAGGYLIVKA